VAACRDMLSIQRPYLDIAGKNAMSDSGVCHVHKDHGFTIPHNPFFVPDTATIQVP